MQAFATLVLLHTTSSTDQMRSLRGSMTPARNEQQASPANRVVQLLAEFVVEDYVAAHEDVLDVTPYSHYTVLKATKLVEPHEDPKLAARDYRLVIRMFLEDCSIHRVHVRYFPGTATKILESREVDTGNSDCGGEIGSGRHPPSSSPGTGRHILPLLSTSVAAASSIQG